MQLLKFSPTDAEKLFYECDKKNEGFIDLDKWVSFINKVTAPSTLKDLVSNKKLKPDFVVNKLNLRKS